MTHRRRRECACGTVVVADPIDPVPGVRDHVRSEPHRSYSDRTSWSGPREREVEVRRATVGPLTTDRIREMLEPYSPGVSAGRLVPTQQVPDNGGVSQPHIEDLDVSLPEGAAA